MQQQQPSRTCRRRLLQGISRRVVVVRCCCCLGSYLSLCRFVGFAVVTSQAGCFQRARSACGCCSSFRYVRHRLRCRRSIVVKVVFVNVPIIVIPCYCWKQILKASSGFLWLFFQTVITEHRACISFHRSFVVFGLLFLFSFVRKMGAVLHTESLLTSY